ncbi:MAG TPA: hypothetical protein VF669_12425 [Tepidisphaeraceae bacterium]|jgi:hypothetical protein
MTSQPDLFPQAPREETIDPEEVRVELMDLLATARAAQDAAPWDRRTHRYHRVVFPQMARWLRDDEEAAQLCFEFAKELDRIELLLAA